MIKKMTNRAMNPETRKFQERAAFLCGTTCEKLCVMLTVEMATPYTNVINQP